MIGQKSVVAYDETGKIIAVAHFDGGSFRDVDRDVYAREGFTSIVVDDTVEYSRRDIYVLNEEIALRPTFIPAISPASIPADGVCPVTISNFPEGATLRISGPINDEWVETGTSTELTVNLPGTYRVTIDHWPHQTAEVTFNAT